MGLLLLEDQADLCYTSMCQTTSSWEKKIYILRRRLGVPSFVLMKEYFCELFSDIDVDTLSWTAYLLAEHQQSSFKVLNVRCLHSFECVGALSYAGGKKCFILFVDDYSSFMWLYLTKSSADILVLIIQFYKMIKTQCEANIKCFRTNNGREFMRVFCTSFHMFFFVVQKG